MWSLNQKDKSHIQRVRIHTQRIIFPNALKHDSNQSPRTLNKLEYLNALFTCITLGGVATTHSLRGKAYCAQCEAAGICRKELH